jgi:hypothetical protein
VTPAQQATNLTDAFSRLVAQRRALHLAGIIWYSWLTNDRSQYWSFWSGLRRPVRGSASRIVSKPALGAYRRVALRVEGCRRKGLLATVCVR